MTTEFRLQVFLSSSLEEFKTVRKTLARRISQKALLICTPLEDTGADTDDVTSASLRGVRDSDIYIGILGKRHSRTTVAEFREAVKLRRRCLVYVKKIDVRDASLGDFIETEVKPAFKFHEFRSNRELYSRVLTDLDKLLLRLLREGLRTLQEAKEKFAEIEQGIRPPSQPTVGKSKALGIISQSRSAIQRGALLEATILLRLAVETGLHEALRKRGIVMKPERMSFGSLVGLAQKENVADREEAHQLQSISFLRNAAAHEGIVPDSRELFRATNSAEKMIWRWQSTIS